MTIDDIVPASKRARIVAIVCVVAGLALLASLPWIAAIAASVGIDPTDPDRAMAQLVFREKLVIVIGSLPLVAGAFVFACRGLAIIRARSYPLPGHGLAWSVRRQTGRAALVTGCAFLTMAAMLLMMAALGFWHWPGQP